MSLLSVAELAGLVEVEVLVALAQALALAFCAYICETGLIHIKDKTQSFMYKLRKSACFDILWLTSF